MGIYGFYRLLLKDDGNSIIKPLKLQNTHLILDGNNFSRLIFSKSCDSVKFGGNYNAYYEYSKAFFLNLKKCNITPITIWDGIHDDGDLPVVKTRWKTAVRQLSTQYINDKNLVPPLIYDVLLDVLNELGITHFVSLTEADKEVAIVAHILNCPILARDTDYCFFNVQYIPWDTVDLELKQNKIIEHDHDYYLDCSIFDRTAFLKQFKLNSDMFEMIPALLGEAHFQKDLFKHFFNRLIESNSDSCKEGNLMNVLLWMQKVGSLDCAIKDILVDAKACDQKEIIKVIHNVYEYYKLDDKPISPYIKISKAESKIEVDDNIEPLILPKEHCLSKLPKYFISLYIKHKISNNFLKVTSQSILFSHITWEDISERSSGEISLPIFSGQLQILKRILGINTANKMVLRKGRAYREVLMYNSENFLLGITSEIFTADVEEKRKVLFEIVDFGETERRVINEIGKDWSVFIISLVYWLKKRRYYMKPKTVEQTKPEAVVMTALAIQAENLLKNRNHKEESVEEGGVPSIFRQMAAITNSELSAFATNFAELRTEKPEIPYSMSTVHGFVLFQSCLLQVMSLNDILNTPFPTIVVHEFLCGILTHNVSELMTNSCFSEIALKESTSVRKLYRYIEGKIREAVV